MTPPGQKRPCHALVHELGLIGKPNAVLSSSLSHSVSGYKFFAVIVKDEFQWRGWQREREVCMIR
jgi:hypothetical protein